MIWFVQRHVMKRRASICLANKTKRRKKNAVWQMSTIYTKWRKIWKILAFQSPQLNISISNRTWTINTIFRILAVQSCPGSFTEHSIYNGVMPRRLKTKVKSVQKIPQEDFHFSPSKNTPKKPQTPNIFCPLYRKGKWSHTCVVTLQ